VPRVPLWAWTEHRLAPVASSRGREKGPILQSGILLPLGRIYSLPCCLGREVFLSQHLQGLLLMLEGMKLPRVVSKPPVPASGVGSLPVLGLGQPPRILVGPRVSATSGMQVRGRTPSLLKMAGKFFSLAISFTCTVSSSLIYCSMRKHPSYKTTPALLGVPVCV